MSIYTLLKHQVLKGSFAVLTPAFHFSLSPSVFHVYYSCSFHSIQSHTLHTWEVETSSRSQGQVRSQRLLSKVTPWKSNIQNNPPAGSPRGLVVGVWATNNHKTLWSKTKLTVTDIRRHKNQNNVYICVYTYTVFIHLYIYTHINYPLYICKYCI